MEITTEYNSWYIIGCAVLAGLYTFFLYWKNKQNSEITQRIIVLLSSLRFLTVFIISLLLVNPLIQRWVTQVDTPIIIIAQDASESILNNKDSAYYTSTYLEELNTLKETVSKNFEVIVMPFGEQVLRNENPLKFEEKRTNFGNVFDEIEARYAGDNVGAVILASDGLFNIGANPNYYTFKQVYPIYTIGLGDTSVKSDISVVEVLHNEIVYLGNQFPVEVGVNAQLLDGEKAKLTIKRNGKVIETRTLEIETDEVYFKERFVFTADKEGTQRYTVSVTEFESELNVINNTHQILIDVIDNRDKVLLVANAPHPDVAAIRSALEKKENIELDVTFISDLTQVLSSYNLIIAHGFGGAENKQIWQKVWGSEIPMWAIIEDEINWASINSLNSGFEVEGMSQKANSMTVAINEGFNNFKISQETKKFLKDCPPLSCAHGEFSGFQESQVFMYQKLGSLQTDFPLLYLMTRNEAKTAWLFGEGIWRWKLFDYQENESHENFDLLIGKVAQFLALKEDKSRFRVSSKKRFTESDNVILNAEVYNKLYELVTESEVELVLTNENGEQFNYVFNTVGSTYTIDLGKLEAGTYTYVSKTNFGGEKFTKSGTFVVKPLNVEWQKVSADFDVLKKLANNTNGQFFTTGELSDLASIFKDKSKFPSITYSSETKKSVFHEKWIFFLLLLLLTMEWGVRKYKGRY